MPVPPVSVQARAVSSIGIMPVHGVTVLVMSCSCSRGERFEGRAFRGGERFGEASVSGGVRWGGRAVRKAGPGRRGAGGSEASGGDVALGGGGVDLETGGAVVLQSVADPAVAGVGVQGGRDAGGGG